MSLKKDKISGPTRSTPSSTQHNYNPNLTVRSSTTSNCRGRLNMTKCVLVPPPSTDWGLQCDLAYGTYLQTLLTRQLITEKIQQNTNTINDQLSLQADLLDKQITEKNTLVEEIEKLELKLKIQNLFETLGILLSCAGKNVNHEMESELNDVLKITEEACDNLYLKQVKPLETPLDYQKFEKLLGDCLKNLEVITTCKDVDSTRQLAECMSTFKCLCGEIAQVQNSVVKLEARIQSNILSYLFDKLAVYNVCD